MRTTYAHTRAGAVFHGFAIRNHAEVARIMGLSRRAVEKIELRAIQKLRHALRDYKPE
jgi:DNA-directed RNA polymerase specialized sigma subunit